MIVVGSNLTEADFLVVVSRTVEGMARSMSMVCLVSEWDLRKDILALSASTLVDLLSIRLVMVVADSQTLKLIQLLVVRLEVLCSFWTLTKAD